MSAARRRAPMVSVIIPTDGRADALERCLRSLQAQQDAPSFEVLVSAPKHDGIHEVVLGPFPSATIVTAEAATAAERRNALIELASAELILFLDDDVEVPTHYLATLMELADSYPEEQVFGGPNVTPTDSSDFQSVQGSVLSSLFGAGPVRRRYGPHRATEADERWFTLCNLAMRRSVVKEFDRDLVGGEENQLLDELHRSGARMRYDPRLWATHERRRDLSGFAKQMFKYGRGRGQLTRRSPRSLRLAYLLPTATIIAILGLAIAAAVGHQPWLAVLIVAYPFALGVEAVAIGWSLRSFAALPTSLLLMVVMHACYGAGVVAGLLSAGPEPPTRNSPVHTWNMLLILVKRQLRLLRKRSVLGLLWPLLAPWVMLILYSFVFHSVLNVPIPRYGVFLFAGLLPWSFLSTALGTAITSLSSEADLIRRRRFPYALLPLAVVIAASVYFLIALLGFIGYLGVRGQLHWATLPAILLPILSLYFFVGAASCVLATIDIYNRDLRQMLANILTVWFFLVPIVYQQRALTHRLLFLRSVDPANLIVGEFRDILYNGQILQPLHGVIVLFATTALLAFATSLVKRVSSSLPKDV